MRKFRELRRFSILNSEAPDSYRDKLLNSEATQLLLNSEALNFPNFDSPIKRLNN